MEIIAAAIALLTAVVNWLAGRDTQRTSGSLESTVNLIRSDVTAVVGSVADLATEMKTLNRVRREEMKLTADVLERTQEQLERATARTQDQMDRAIEILAAK